MFKKVYESIKDFISENIRELIFLLGFYVVMTYPLPYYVFVSGGTIDVSNRVTIVDEYDSDGSFSLAYVNELKGTLPTYLLSYIIPNWTLYEASDYTYDDSEDVSDISVREKLQLQESLQNSTLIAYEAAGKEIEITDVNYYIYYATESAKESADIKVGDILLSYDGNEVEDITDYRDYVQSLEEGELVDIVLERNGKEIETSLKVYEEDGTNYTGIMILTMYDYEVEPEITFNFTSSESGSSGGLTLALAIYNKLTEDDITNGLDIVGTGTIEIDGSVGAIGGVEYKLKGAVKAKADLFIVPNGSNYEEAVKLKEENGYDIEIIGVDTFDDALEQIEEYTKDVK